jgi:GNAT superfamily N-acetyltransferase
MTLNPDQFTARLGKGQQAPGWERITLSERIDDGTEQPRGTIEYVPPSVSLAGGRRMPFPADETGQTRWLNQHPGALDDFYVDPEHQGRGIGGMLLNAAQEVHQQRFGRGSVAGANEGTAVSDDTIGVVNHYGAGSAIERAGRWSESKVSRDKVASAVVAMAKYRVHQYGPQGALGEPVEIQTSLQDKLHRAGFTPEPEPPSDGSKQLSMLSKKESKAPQVKKELL